MYKVFISHGSEDAWVAGQLAECVHNAGADTFLDETNISKGDNFKNIIHKEVHECNELLALFTPWSATRFWVWTEIGAVWGQSKRIVAVLYGISVNELEQAGGSKGVLEDINILELNDIDEYFSELIERIKDFQHA